MGRSPRMQMTLWGGWYFLAIGALLWLIGLRYLAAFPWPADAVARLYAVLAFTSHFEMLALAAWLLLPLPLALLLPRRLPVMAAGVAVGAALLAGVLVDSLVFAEDRFHLSALSLAILGSSTWRFAALYFAIFLALCALLARATWQRAARLSGRSFAAAVGGAVLGPYLCAQALHVWADATFYLPVTSLTPYLPLYRPWSARSALSSSGLAGGERAQDASLMQQVGGQEQGLLHYPLAPLHCAFPAKLPNVLLIGLDAMRPDTVNPRIAPHIARFAEGALRFERHWSGGNGTRVGLFSLFYGLPATYWRAFYAQQRSPVLIDELQAAGYQMGIFPGNPPDQIVGLDRTAFRNVPDLVATRGDAELAEAWIRWLEARDRSKPFFSFLFFESAPGGCKEGYERPTPVPPHATEMQRRRSCYDAAIHYADAQAGRVLDELAAQGLLDSTIVIVTSDHGQEFDENGLDFHGHGSSYSEYQLHTPFIVRWPGRPPGRVERRTSHNDVAPTLLRDVLGCDSPPADYSSGGDLFSGPEWRWLVAASYTGFAVVEPTQVTISSDVYFETRDAATYRLLSSPKLDREVLLRAIRETSRFHGG
jgi:membrane-anchored protein YejM (alkaline phosphatase superfamily)